VVDTSARRPVSVALLVGLVLLVTAATAAAFAFVPLAKCPLHVGPTSEYRTGMPYPCPGCNDTNRVSLLRKWQFTRNPE
jgi:hypothetical protein